MWGDLRILYNDSMEIVHVIEQLNAFYGTVRWHHRRDGLTELIQTILSQQTTDVNSLRAYAELRHRHGDWPAIHALSHAELSDAIRVAGLAHRKATYILATLDVAATCQPAYSIEFLANLLPQAAMTWLTRIPGIGPKTAACVLMFAYGMPLTPVDTHVARLCTRLALVPQRTATSIQSELEHRVPDHLKYAFHVHLIRLGREVCHAQTPYCGMCPLQQECPSAQPRGRHV